MCAETIIWTRELHYWLGLERVGIELWLGVGCAALDTRPTCISNAQTGDDNPESVRDMRNEARGSTRNRPMFRAIGIQPLDVSRAHIGHTHFPRVSAYYLSISVPGIYIGPTNIAAYSGAAAADATLTGPASMLYDWGSTGRLWLVWTGGYVDKFLCDASHRVGVVEGGALAVFDLFVCVGRVW